MRTPVHRLPSPHLKRQHGAALLIILTIIGIGAAVMLVSALNNASIRNERDRITADALAKAKDALIGYAVTYRDSHPNNVFGYLPCPDVNNDGNADANQGSTQCAGKDIPVVGRLPWKTLGLPPLHDGAGECLWYAVSGTFKAVAGGNLTDFMNWDSIGQFLIQDASGSTIAGTTAHDRPAAVIFSAGRPLGVQSHPASIGQECSGDASNSIAAYLDGSNVFSPPSSPPAAPIVLTMGGWASATNNDALLWVTPSEIFSRIKKRTDFASDINTLLTDLTIWLNSPASLPLPATPSGGKDFDNVYTDCLAAPSCYQNTTAKKLNVLNNWRDNFLYRRLTSPANVMIGSTTYNNCSALLIFSGERATGQTRATAIDKNVPANYLEGGNTSYFSQATPPGPPNTPFSGAGSFINTGVSQDVLACIGGVTQVTFASHFGSFQPYGAGVTTNPGSQTVTVAAATGSSGGCFWFPTAIQLNGKTLRAYYDFTFTNADPIGAQDLGNGFTFSLLRGDAGAPNACGTQSNMGALGASTAWGNISLLLETDIHQDNANNEPSGTANHTAIMANGNANHSATNGNLTSACNGTAQGCLHSPANKFEELPTPQTHNQRVEIHTEYSDGSCTSTTAGGAYAEIKVWSDCLSCGDTSADFPSIATARRCVALDAAMGSIYFGFTGGFSSTGGGQGVTIRNLDLRTQ